MSRLKKTKQNKKRDVRIDEKKRTEKLQSLMQSMSRKDMWKMAMTDRLHQKKGFQEVANITGSKGLLILRCFMWKFLFYECLDSIDQRHLGLCTGSLMRQIEFVRKSTIVFVH